MPNIPDELLAKMEKIKGIFPEGFVIFLPPENTDNNWIKVFRYNPQNLILIDNLYEKVVGQSFTTGSQN